MKRIIIYFLVLKKMFISHKLMKMHLITLLLVGMFVMSEQSLQAQDRDNDASLDKNKCLVAMVRYAGNQSGTVFGVKVSADYIVLRNFLNGYSTEVCDIGAWNKHRK